VFEDKHFYGRIWAADHADDWMDPATWANPHISQLLAKGRPSWHN